MKGKQRLVDLLSNSKSSSEKSEESSVDDNDDDNTDNDSDNDYDDDEEDEDEEDMFFHYQQISDVALSVRCERVCFLVFI